MFYQQAKAADFAECVCKRVFAGPVRLISVCLSAALDLRLSSTTVVSVAVLFVLVRYHCQVSQAAAVCLESLFCAVFCF